MRTIATAGAVVLALSLTVSIAGINAGLAILTVAALMRVREEGRRATDRLSEPLLLALLAYAVWGVVSAGVSADAAASSRTALKDWHKVWTLAVLLLTADLADGPTTAAAAGVGACVGATLGIAQVVSGFVARAHGTVHPVSYGGLMALATLVAGVSFAGGGEGRRGRAASAAVAALCCAAAILSQTRSAILAIVAGTAVAALERPRWRRMAAWAAASATAAAAAIMTFAPAQGRGAGESYTPLGMRVVLWSVAWDAFLSKPWTGLGPGRYGAWYAAHGPMLDLQTVWTNAHNILFHQAAERGLPGLVILLGVAACAGAGAKRSLRRGGNAAALVCTAAFAVLNMFETSFQTEQVATGFLAVWAWAESRPR